MSYFEEKFLEELKNQTATIADRLLTHSKDGKFICPFCGNGSRQDGTGIKFNGEVAHCFVCDKGFNIIAISMRLLKNVLKRAALNFNMMKIIKSKTHHFHRLKN